MDQAKNKPPKRPSSLPGVIVLASAAVFVFAVMLIAMYRSGMVKPPEFLAGLEFFGGGEVVEQDEFMAAFEAALEGAKVQSQSETIREQLDDDAIQRIIDGSDTAGGRRVYTITAASGDNLRIFRATITADSLALDELTNGIYRAAKTVSVDDSGIVITESAPDGTTTERVLPAADAFSLQSEAGIPLIADVLRMSEQGGVTDFTARLVRSTSESDRNVVMLTYTYTDTDIAESCEIDAETGALYRVITSLNGVPYYLAELVSN